VSAEHEHIDAHLRDEFVQEVNKIMSTKNNLDQDLQEEFAREVERLSANTDKRGK
jgi:NTP pyrophosphatase (non-canonical NTP hydrolase)